MLGYSDSTKESGALASAWMLYRRAGASSWSVARQRDIELTLFHGRGGAIGRGGGPMTRAVVAQAAGSVDGRLKLTEQGEVVADRYVNPSIALRHLEQLTYATLEASVPRARSPPPGAAEVMAELADRCPRRIPSSRLGDARIRGVLPRCDTRLRELSALTIGSRPAARGARAAPRPASRHCARSRGSSRGRSRAPTCPAGTARARALADFRVNRGASGPARAARRCTRIGRSSAPCSTRPRWSWPRRTCRSRHATHRWRRRQARASCGSASGRNTRRPSSRS